MNQKRISTTGDIPESLASVFIEKNTDPNSASGSAQLQYTDPSESMRGAAKHDNKRSPGSESNNAGPQSQLENPRDDIGEDADGLGHGNIIIGSEKKWAKGRGI